MEQYISKSALVAEIDKGINWRNDWQLDEYRKGYHDALTMLKKYLSTLEVKEVDLEKEANECWNYVFSELGWDKNSIITMKHDEFMAFAKHFFELGLKAQKGE